MFCLSKHPIRSLLCCRSYGGSTGLFSILDGFSHFLPCSSSFWLSVYNSLLSTQADVYPGQSDPILPCIVQEAWMLAQKSGCHNGIKMLYWDSEPLPPNRNNNPSVSAISNASLADWDGRCLCSVEFSDWMWRSVAKCTGKKCKITRLQAQTYFPHAIVKVYSISSFFSEGQ